MDCNYARNVARTLCMSRCMLRDELFHLVPKSIFNDFPYFPVLHFPLSTFDNSFSSPEFPGPGFFDPAFPVLTFGSDGSIELQDLTFQ